MRIIASPARNKGAPPIATGPDIASLAPEAAGNSWRPQSFLAPIAANEPGWLSGLAAVGRNGQTAATGGINSRWLRASATNEV